jgi:tetratricopeptide (TPR) repeat protein
MNTPAPYSSPLRVGREPSGRTAYRLGLALLLALIASHGREAHAQTGEAVCGSPFTSWFGPFDYRRAPDEALRNVETNHFTPAVEQLVRGVTTDAKSMGKDVAYVLGVFPNHHRALLTMMRMGERDGTDPPRGASLPIECWFDRAVRYARDDTVARLMYALWLRKKGRAEESLFHTKAAEAEAKDNPMTYYNVGMSYFELGKFEQAAAAPRRAKELGITQPGLINRLKSVNQWTEPAAQ